MKYLILNTSLSNYYVDFNFYCILDNSYRLCGLVVRVPTC
jgi:hypothetical protein